MDPSLPCPPSYSEAIEGENPNPTSHGGPPSLDSSQSELTVGSDHQSDSSSSSDEATTWGNYAGDGEGRRGRRERHASSESERSRANQRPENEENVNIATNRAGNDNRQRKKLNEKLSSKEGDNVDTCVIPDGPKPGMEGAKVDQIKPYAQPPLESLATGRESHTVEVPHELTNEQELAMDPGARSSPERRAPHPKPLRYRDRQRQRESNDRNPMFRSTGDLLEGAKNLDSGTGAMYKRNPINRSEQNLTDSRHNADFARQENKNIHRSTPNLTNGAGLSVFDHRDKEMRPENSQRNPPQDNREYYRSPERRNPSENRDQNRRYPNNDQYNDRDRRNQSQNRDPHRRNPDPNQPPNRNKQTPNYDPNRRDQNSCGDRENQNRFHDPNRRNQNPNRDQGRRNPQYDNQGRQNQDSAANQNPNRDPDRRNPQYDNQGRRNQDSAANQNPNRDQGRRNPHYDNQGRRNQDSGANQNPNRDQGRRNPQYDNQGRRNQDSAANQNPNRDQGRRNPQYDNQGRRNQDSAANQNENRDQGSRNPQYDNQGRRNQNADAKPENLTRPRYIKDKPLQLDVPTNHYAPRSPCSESPSQSDSTNEPTDGIQLRTVPGISQNVALAPNQLGATNDRPENNLGLEESGHIDVVGEHTEADRAVILLHNDEEGTNDMYV